MSRNLDIRQAIQSVVSENLHKNTSQYDGLKIVHGFVSKVNKNEGKSGSINFISIDGTIKINDIPILSIADLEKGCYCEPNTNSDVTVLWKVGTGDATILSFSHISIQTINATDEVHIGVTGETENNEVDYNEFENSGDKTESIYTKTEITHTASNKTDTATQIIKPDGYSSEVGKSLIEQNKEEIKQSVGGSYQKIDNQSVTVEGTAINLGENPTSQALLGTETALLLVDFITACSQIMVPTMLGTMPIVNIPQFTTLIPRCEQIKSQIVKLK